MAEGVLGYTAEGLAGVWDLGRWSLRSSSRRMRLGVLDFSGSYCLAAGEAYV